MFFYAYIHDKNKNKNKQIVKENAPGRAQFS